jgi:general secretion pathway protein G
MVRSMNTSRQHGFTLVELIVATGILAILVGAAFPLVRMTIYREREHELREDLWMMRDAIDRYKDAADRNLIRVEAGTEGYPPDLETLVKGVDLTSQTGGGIAGATTPGQPIVPSTGFGGFGGGFGGGAFGQTPTQGQNSGSSQGQDLIRHVRFLRRIPVDPMTGRAEWGMRAVQDDPDSTSWGGKNVFDVFSLSSATALDDTKYSDW